MGRNFSFLLLTSLLALEISPSARAMDSGNLILTQKPSVMFTFQGDKNSPINQEAAKFLNSIGIRDKTYDEVLKAILAKDRELSLANKAIPGAFTNASAQLFSTVDIKAKDFPHLGDSAKTSAVIKTKEELLNFAKILDEKAKDIYNDPTLLGERLASLEQAIATRKAEGKPVKEVVIYLNDPSEKSFYEKLPTIYPDTTFNYREFPTDYSQFLASAGAITAALIFFYTLPKHYPAIYDGYWHPYLKKYKTLNVPIYYGKYNLLNHYHIKSPVKKEKPILPVSPMVIAPAIAPALIAPKPPVIIHKDRRYYRHVKPHVTHRPVIVVPKKHVKGHKGYVAKPKHHKPHKHKHR